MPNIIFAKAGVKCFYESLVQGSSSVFQMNISTKNPRLRKYEKRYVPFLNDNANRYRQTNEFT